MIAAKTMANNKTETEQIQKLHFQPTKYVLLCMIAWYGWG